MALPAARPSSHLDKFASRLASTAPRAQNVFGQIGQFVVFTAQTLWLLPVTAAPLSSPNTACHERSRLGSGVDHRRRGVISVLVILGVAIGGTVAVEAYSTLNLIGFGALSGIVGGLANVREMAPLVAGIAFASQAGCRMTAEIGAMRIAEEIDAVEAMGLRPIPFVVGTRLVGAMVTVIPGFLLTLVTSFLRVQHRDSRLPRSAGRHLPALLRPVPAVRRHRLLAGQGDGILRRSDADPLLLRLLHQWWPRRRRPGVRDARCAPAWSRSWSSTSS